MLKSDTPVVAAWEKPVAGPDSSVVGKPAAAGEVVRSLGLEAVPSEYTDDVVNMAFAAKTPPLLTSKFAGPGDGVDKPSAGKAAGEQTALLEEQGAQERLLRAKKADQMSLDSVKALTGNLSLEASKKAALAAKETELASLSVLHFSGWPAGSGQDAFGAGFIMLSKLDDRTRLHMKITEQSSQFRGREEWGEQNRATCVCCCIKRTEDTYGKYRSSRRVETLQTAIAADGAIFHAHTYLADAVEGALQFDLTKPAPAEPCCTLPKFDFDRFACCYCVCPESCPRYSARHCSPWCCIDYSCCCMRAPLANGGTWEDEVLQGTEDAVKQKQAGVAQEQIEELSQKFPETPLCSEKRCDLRAGVTTTSRHNLQFTYKNPQSNSIGVCTVLIDPSEPPEKVSRFLAELSSLVSAYPEEAQLGSIWARAPEMQTMGPGGFGFGGASVDRSAGSAGGGKQRNTRCRSCCQSCYPGRACLDCCCCENCPIAGCCLSDGTWCCYFRLVDGLRTCAGCGICCRRR